jgi:hypothetical protein
MSSEVLWRWNKMQFLPRYQVPTTSRGDCRRWKPHFRGFTTKSQCRHEEYLATNTWHKFKCFTYRVAPQLRPRFDPKSGHMRLFVDIVVLGGRFSPRTWTAGNFENCTINPPRTFDSLRPEFPSFTSLQNKLFASVAVAKLSWMMQHWFSTSHRYEYLAIFNSFCFFFFKRITQLYNTGEQNETETTQI